MTKQERWYEIDGNTVYVYDHPYPDRAQSVSVVRIADLEYYRRTFRLTKVWTNDSR